MHFFDHLELIDTRKNINKEYELEDIVFLTMAALLSGATGWKAIEIFGRAQIDWLKRYRPFLNGIPTRHSIGRIIRGIEPQSFVNSFIHWINEIRGAQGTQQIAFDGKVLTGSGKRTDKHALQLMTAMLVEEGLVIYQKETDSKTNEIPIMQKMLEAMEIKGNVITADAMHCQTKTAEMIQEKGGEYILQIKGNQSKLLNEVKAYFHKVEREQPEHFEANCHTDVDGEHGRITERSYRVLPITSWLKETKRFNGSQAVIEVHRKTQVKGKQQEERSYYLTTLKTAARDIGEKIRRHWSIENSQHWVLDVTFKEDECKIYAEDGAKNLASMRRVLLNMAKQHRLKDSVAGKMQRASWDSDFRAEILFGVNTVKV